MSEYSVEVIGEKGQPTLCRQMLDLCGQISTEQKNPKKLQGNSPFGQCTCTCLLFSSNNLDMQQQGAVVPHTAGQILVDLCSGWRDYEWNDLTTQ